jgi:hypothetical protein
MGINKSKIVLGGMGFLLFLVLCFAGYTWLTLNWSYSKGERAGYIQKFSTKGWLCKTWEGELSMVPVPGGIPEKFFFSVRDDAVAERINRSMGKKITLYYEQHKGVPTQCFGETEYFATEIRILE